MIYLFHMEMIDILNADGTSADYIESKEEVHKKGLWHRTAHVWFVNDKNEILLQKRAQHITSNPGKWDISAAGHLSAGDDPIQGALREVKEELDVDLSETDLNKIGEVVGESTQHDGVYINKEYQDVYVVFTDKEVQDFTIQESEVEKIEFVSIEKLKKWVSEEKEDLVLHKKEFGMLFDYLEGR